MLRSVVRVLAIAIMVAMFSYLAAIMIVGALMVLAVLELHITYGEFRRERKNSEQFQKKSLQKAARQERIDIRV